MDANSMERRTLQPRNEGDEEQDKDAIILPQAQSPGADQDTSSSDDDSDDSQENFALQPESLLMTLPPEMRNRIYRACLVEGETIIHSSHTSSDLPTEPALLRTCQQIRKEATSIYYKENEFTFHIVAHDAGNYVRWCKSARRRLQCHHGFAFVDYHANWDNLMVWLDAYWHRKCYTPSNEDEDGALPMDVIGHVRNILNKLKLAGLRWETVKPMLEDVRKLLGQRDVGWLA